MAVSDGTGVVVVNLDTDEFYVKQEIDDEIAVVERESTVDFENI